MWCIEEPLYKLHIEIRFRVLPALQYSNIDVFCVLRMGGSAAISANLRKAGHCNAAAVKSAFGWEEGSEK